GRPLPGRAPLRSRGDAGGRGGHDHSGRARRLRPPGRRGNRFRRGVNGVHLSPREIERVLLFSLSELARRRRAKGLKLNYPEALALIRDEVMEAAREGASLEEAAARGASVLGPDDVMDGVADLLQQVQVEAVFADGSRLVTVRQPIRGQAAAGASPSSS